MPWLIFEILLTVEFSSARGHFGDAHDEPAKTDLLKSRQPPSLANTLSDTNANGKKKSAREMTDFFGSDLIFDQTAQRFEGSLALWVAIGVVQGQAVVGGAGPKGLQ